MTYEVFSVCLNRGVFTSRFLSILKQQRKTYGRSSCEYSTSIQDAKPFKSIPGLSSLPYIGPIHHFLPIIGQFGPKTTIFNLVGILHERYGPIVKMKGAFGRADMVLLFNPEDIDQVYRSQESNPIRPAFETIEYYRGVARKETFGGVNGLITSHGAQWRDFRTKVNPALLKLKLVRVYSTPLEEIARDFVNRLKEIKDDKTHIRDHFNSEIEKWSLESIAFVGLGARLGCLTEKLTNEHPAHQLMECAKSILQSSFLLEVIPSPWKYISTPAYKRLVKTLDKQWEISAMFIEQARQHIDGRGHDIPDEDKSIIEKLLAIDEKVAVMMANDMLLAGIDTVSFTTIGVLYHLASHPEKQDKLRQELQSGDRRYLRACLKETLRFWHVVPSNLRRTDKDHVVCGYHIPPGVDIVAPNEYLSRMEKYYPRPNEYLPERWLADKTDPLYYGNAHPMVTLPFGFGIRSCIGRRISELEIELLIKNLIEEFNVTWEGPPIKIINKFTNTFDKPYNFRFATLK